MSSDFDSMEAGREMDRLIARYVFGWLPYKGNEDKLHPTWRSEQFITCCGSAHWWLDENRRPKCTNDSRHGWIPKNYSTRIDDAWEVVEKLRLTHGFWIDGDGDNEDTYNYEVDFQHGMIGSAEFSKGTAKALTAPLAICRAALKAVNSAA